MRRGSGARRSCCRRRGRAAKRHAALDDELLHTGGECRRDGALAARSARVTVMACAAFAPAASPLPPSTRLTTPQIALAAAFPSATARWVGALARVRVDRRHRSCCRRRGCQGRRRRSRPSITSAPNTCALLLQVPLQTGHFVRPVTYGRKHMFASVPNAQLSLFTPVNPHRAVPRAARAATIAARSARRFRPRATASCTPPPRALGRRAPSRASRPGADGSAPAAH